MKEKEVYLKGLWFLDEVKHFITKAAVSVKAQLSAEWAVITTYKQQCQEVSAPDAAS